MARYTTVYSSMWDNTQVQGLLKDGKLSAMLLYIFLLTNSSTNIIGYYQLSLPAAAAYLATSEVEILVGLKELEEKGLIMYDDKTSSILMLDFFSHNSFPKGEKQITSMGSQLKLMKRNKLDSFFVHQVFKYAKEDLQSILKVFPAGMCEQNEELTNTKDHSITNQ